MSCESEFSFQALFAVLCASGGLHLPDGAYPDLQQFLFAVVSSGHSTSTVCLCPSASLLVWSWSHMQLCLCNSALAADAGKVQPGQVWQDLETEALCCMV